MIIAYAVFLYCGVLEEFTYSVIEKMETTAFKN